MNPLEVLRHHVSGAIARGEAVAITDKSPRLTPYIDAARREMEVDLMRSRAEI